MTPKQVVVKVNGQVIPSEAIAFELSRLVRFYAQHMPEEQVRSQLDALRRKAVDQAIGAKLLIDEAMRLDIQVTETEVDERVQAMAEEAGGLEPLQAELKKQGISEATFRDQIKRGRRVDKLVEMVTAGVNDPGEDDIRAHFDSHRAEFQRAERAQAQHILVAPTSKDAAGRAAARAKIEAIRARLQAGGSFADEAAAHSECPSGKQSAGSLGWFGRGMMVKAFDDAVFSLQVGELSAIVETEFGFHVIRKTAHEEAAEAEFDDVRENIRDFLRHAARGEVLSAHVAELRAQAQIEIKPA
jgi:parvulin-like peptidyl-prolyl isomerase